MALRPSAGSTALYCIPPLLALLALPACKTVGGRSTGAELKETEVRAYEDELGMKPAVGFEGILEDVRGTCVDFDGLETGGTSQEAQYDIQLIESSRDLSGKIGISAAAQVRSAAPNTDSPTSRKTKFALGNVFSINRYSVFVMVSARVRNETTFLKNPRVKAEQKAAVEANPATALGQFRSQCGDSYLTGYSTGGEFVALIEIKTDTDETTASIKGKYSQQGNGNGATTTGAMQGNLASLSANRDIRIWTFQRGGAGEEEVGLVTSVDELMNRLKGLADSVKQGTNPRPLTATFADYMTLSLNLPAEYRTKLDAAKSVMRELADVQAGLLDLQGNLDYILTQPASFVGVDAAKLVQMRDMKAEIDRRARRVLDVGKGCATDYVNCKKPAELSVPAFELPRRKPNLQALSQEKLKVKTTLHYANVNKLRDGVWNPAECYVQINAGKGDGNRIPVRRNETDFSEPRCRNLATEFSIPVAILKDAFANLGASVDNGWIEVQLFEDDPYYDDLIGSTWVYFKDLKDGAKLQGINNSLVNLDAGLEIEY